MVSRLRAHGCRANGAENGREALSAVAGEAYDLVLMDCHMPELDGFEAAAEIRRRERKEAKNKRLPIVALTGGSLEDRERCLADGMDDCLFKPLNRKRLKAAVERWLMPAPDEGPPRQAMPAQPAAAERGPTAPLLERKALDEIRALQRDGRPDLLAKVIGIYLESAPKLLESIRRAVTRGDADAIRAAAHRLKSSSANLGAVQFAEMCWTLETMGRDNDLQGVEQALAKAEGRFPELCRTIDEERRGKRL